MPSARTLAALFLLLTLTASAQTPTPAPHPANAAIAHVFHPTSPLPSYDVATIKPYDPSPMQGGMTRLANTTLRDYIRGAFAPEALLSTSQVVGGPEWIDKDRYTIQAKPPGDLEVAMQKMKNDDRLQLDHAMRQSLLAERFHLKVHFEVREMPVYALVPAKGGLKIKPPADTAPPPDPNNPASGPPSKRPMPPSSLQVMMGANGVRVLRAHAISMDQFAGMIGGFMEQANSNFISISSSRPVLNQTGFSGEIDVDSLRWAASLSAAPDPSADAASAPTDAPSLTTALEETLGLKLILTKGPVEVVVIDSIDHPSEN